MSDKPLLPHHLRFVHEYLKDGNATQAYIRAGYSPKHAQSCASRLLTEPHIEAALAAGRQRLAQSLEVDVQRVAQEYAKIAFANIGDFIAVGEDGRLRIDIARAGQAQSAGLLEMVVTHSKRSQTVRLKLSKLKVLEILTRHIDVLGEKPAPGLSAEDRARLEAENAALRQAEAQRQSEPERLRRELLEARQALANTQVEIDRIRHAVPHEDEPSLLPEEDDEASPPEETITKPPIVIWLAEAAAQQAMPGLYPTVWSGGHQPGDPPASYEVLRHAMTNHDKGR